MIGDRMVKGHQPMLKRAGWPRQGGQRQSRGGFTILELLVVLAIVGLLVALGLPALQRARAAAVRVQCQSNLRNITLAMLHVEETTGRFPAAGNFGRAGQHHSWVVDLLPWLDQSNIALKWDRDKPRRHPVNQELANLHIPVMTCPADISVIRKAGNGDLSYVVNGGVGFTVQWSDGTHDCPIAPHGGRLDLNANGVVCPPDEADDGTPSDKDYFLRMGLFFNETWNWDVTRRHHRLSTVTDGLTNTIMLTENVRTGYNPDRPQDTWASSNPYLTSFYIGNPCRNGDCSAGNVDYRLSNSGSSAINSGLASPEGTSAVPNSFHQGGVFMSFCDGRVRFVSEALDGRVYAALVSPQGQRLDGTPLEQMVVTGDEY